MTQIHPSSYLVVLLKNTAHPTSLFLQLCALERMGEPL